MSIVHVNLNRNLILMKNAKVLTYILVYIVQMDHRYILLDRCKSDYDLQYDIQRPSHKFLHMDFDTFDLCMPLADHIHYWSHILVGNLVVHQQNLVDNYM